MSERFQPVAERFYEFRQRAGKRIGRGFHLLRHTFATNLAAHVDVFRLQGWLGHKDIKMTERYVHLSRAYDPAIEKATP
jgi:integrase